MMGNSAIGNTNGFGPFNGGSNPCSPAYKIEEIFNEEKESD